MFEAEGRLYADYMFQILNHDITSKAWRVYFHRMQITFTSFLNTHTKQVTDEQIVCSKKEERQKMQWEQNSTKEPCKTEF